MGYILVYSSIYFLSGKWHHIGGDIIFMGIWNIYSAIGIIFLSYWIYELNCLQQWYSTIYQRGNTWKQGRWYILGADIRNGDFGKFYILVYVCTYGLQHKKVIFLWVSIREFIIIGNIIYHFNGFGTTSIARLGAEFMALSYNWAYNGILTGYSHVNHYHNHTGNHLVFYLAFIIIGNTTNIGTQYLFGINGLFIFTSSYSVLSFGRANTYFDYHKTPSGTTNGNYSFTRTFLKLTFRNIRAGVCWRDETDEGNQGR